MTKRKMNSVSTLAGESIRNIDTLPGSVLEKCNANTIADLCRMIDRVRMDARQAAALEAMTKHVRRFPRVGEWFRSLRESLRFDRVELPRLAVGIAAIRARFDF